MVWLLIVLVPVLLVAGAIALLWPDGGGTAFVGPDVASVDGRLVARVHEQNCGAPCDFDVRVEIEHAGETGTILNGNMHPCTVILQWETADRLLVVYPPGFQVTEHQPGLSGLSVRFEQREPVAAELTAAWGTTSPGECYTRHLQ